jgi:hypothetical protein
VETDALGIGEETEREEAEQHQQAQPRQHAQVLVARPLCTQARSQQRDEQQRRDQ